MKDWFLAARHGNIAFLRTHIANFATLTNGEERTALMLAAQHGHTGAVELLRAAEAGRVTDTTALILAVKENRLAIVRLLVELEYSLRTSDGATALMVAASEASAEITEILLQYLGGESDSHYRTALEYATLGSRSDNLSLLLGSSKFTRAQVQNAYYYSLTVTQDVDIREMLAEAMQDAEELALDEPDEESLQNYQENMECMIRLVTEREQKIEQLTMRIAELEAKEDSLKALLANNINCITVEEAYSGILRSLKRILPKSRAVSLCEPLGQNVELSHAAVQKAIIDDVVRLAAERDLVREKLRTDIRSIRMQVSDLAKGSRQLSRAVASAHGAFGKMLINSVTDIYNRTCALSKANVSDKSPEKGTTDVRRGATSPKAQGRTMVDKAIYAWAPIQQPITSQKPSFEPIMSSLIESVRSLSTRRGRSGPGDSTILLRGRSRSRLDSPRSRSTFHLAVASPSRSAVMSPVLSAQQQATDRAPTIRSPRHEPVVDLPLSALRTPVRDAQGYTALMRAALNNDVNSIYATIDDAGARLEDGRTALMLAAEAGCAQAVQVLSEYEGNMQIEEGKQKGTTALILALEKKHFDIALSLTFEAGHQRLDGATALLLATMHNVTDVALRLIDSESNIFIEGSTTPLMNAAAQGNAELVEHLLSEARQTKSGGWTALMIASQKNYDKCVRVLAGQEGGMQRDDGTTAMMLAANAGHIEVVKLLKPQEAGLTHVKGHTALVLAARANHVGIVELLLDIEGGIPAKNTITALMYSSQRGNAACVRALIPKEARMTSDDQWTALMYAALHDRSDIVELLVGHEAGMQRTRYTGATAMIIAAEHNAIQSVRVLAPHEKGLRDNAGFTALMVAAQRGYVEVVRVLIPFEARLVTPAGISAMMIAAQGNHLECVRLLDPYEGEIAVPTALDQK
ncbi:Ankyrin repeat protein 1 [Giardia muris]|uniref:Ankyrin repeat protein 1 n=1 Tax=Giardia muris TaxID=5742 RepID=A0A4Z1T9I1_GIAMU|nr:Ankyrin repeat protein 1 [Giardia muris]|eukprot:TNJ29807.1 Ankyrin repeat protein 1 [Giardia muris]